MKYYADFSVLELYMHFTTYFYLRWASGGQRELWLFRKHPSDPDPGDQETVRLSWAYDYGLPRRWSWFLL